MPRRVVFENFAHKDDPDTTFLDDLWQEEMELIAQLREPTKEKRQMAKRRDVKRIGEFIFDEEIQKQFKILDIPIPGSIEDISMTLQLLEERVTRSEKPELNTEIQAGQIDELDALSPSI